MLSHSYFLNVSYMEGDDVLKEVSWFVKVHPHSRKNNSSNSKIVQIFETLDSRQIPKSLSTAPMDETEAFYYTKLLPKLTGS